MWTHTATSTATTTAAAGRTENQKVDPSVCSKSVRIKMPRIDARRYFHSHNATAGSCVIANS